MLKFVDIHTHVNFPDFDADREAVIGRALAAGVGMINVGVNLETSWRAVTLARGGEGVWATVGIHPTDLPPPDALGKTVAGLEVLAQDPKVVAIGECGLDYGRNPKREALSTKQIQSQKEIFAKQIALARGSGKPLMIHCRDAYEDLYDFLVSDFDIRASDLKCNMHFFAGDWPTAKKFLDLGFTLSFTGVITFTHDYDEVIKNTPLGMIMSETDAPFVAPVPYRGQRNEPAYVVEVVKRLAEIKGVGQEVVEATLLANARRLFRLPA